LKDGIDVAERRTALDEECHLLFQVGTKWNTVDKSRRNECSDRTDLHLV